MNLCPIHSSIVSDEEQALVTDRNRTEVHLASQKSAKFRQDIT